MINIVHTRVKWDSVNGVQIVPVDYDKYPAKDGYTDIRWFELSLDDYEMNLPISAGKTIAGFAKDEDAEIVINATFAYNGSPVGYIVKDGELINKNTSAPQWIDFMIRNGKAEIGQLDPNNLPDFSISGTPQIVKDGKVYVNVHGEKTPKDVYKDDRARTGQGIKKDGTLIYVIVDEDPDIITKPKSQLKWDAGLHVAELGRVMIHLGAWNAMNLDGGGSACVAQNGEVKSANKGLRPLGAAITFKKKNVNSSDLIKVDKVSGEHVTNPKIEPKGLTVHTTANRSKGATALMHDRYYDNNSDRVSVHWTVDAIHAVQSLDEFRAAWHAGNRDYNLSYIGMEICENNVSNNTLDYDTYNNAILLASDILNRHGWGTDKMIQHRDVPGREWKNCPNTDLIDWEVFKAAVQLRLKKVEIIENPIDKSEILKLIQRAEANIAEAKQMMKGVK